jgi:hypothetical protein
VTWDSLKGYSSGKQEGENEIWSLEKNRRSYRYLQLKTIDFILI